MPPPPRSAAEPEKGEPAGEGSRRLSPEPLSPALSAGEHRGRRAAEIADFSPGVCRLSWGGAPSAAVKLSAGNMATELGRGGEPGEVSASGRLRGLPACSRHGPGALRGGAEEPGPGRCLSGARVGFYRGEKPFCPW